MRLKEKLGKYLKEEKAPNEKIEQEILNLLMKYPSPDDAKIHDLSDKLGIDTHEFESYIYDFLGSFVGHGRMMEKGFKEEDADPKELEMGIKVEMEHTNNKTMAKRIALDHLAEIDNYYTLLIKMEKDAGVED